MKHLLLLHGAIGDASQLLPLADSLKAEFDVHPLNFPGHGGSAMPDVFSIDFFASHVLDYIEEKKLDEVFIFGYSMGGYVALTMAKNHPQGIAGIFTLATKFNWSPEIALRESAMLNPGKIAEKIPVFAQSLEKRHAPNDWKEVLHKTSGLMKSIGGSPLRESDLATIEIPVRLGIGDSDQMVSVDETKWAEDHLPNSSVVIFPETQHPIEKVNLTKLASELRSFNKQVE